LVILAEPEGGVQTCQRSRHSALPTGAGRRWPSRLSLIGHTRDSLWSVDLFRCESILMQSY